MRACENSEVLPPALVAVAVTPCPGERAVEKLKEALPVRLVVNRFWPRKVSPSPKPVGKFGAGLEKSWTVNENHREPTGPHTARYRVKSPPSL